MTEEVKTIWDETRCLAIALWGFFLDDDDAES